LPSKQEKVTAAESAPVGQNNPAESSFEGISAADISKLNRPAMRAVYREHSDHRSIHHSAGPSVDDVFVGSPNPRPGNFPANCGTRQVLPIWCVGGVRGDFLFWSAASRAAAQLCACRRISSSVKVVAHFCSPSPARSRSPRHNKGSSCTRMPYFRMRPRSALTVYSVRTRPAAAPSNANTRNSLS